MPIEDRFALYSASLAGPATRSVDVTPDDDADLPFRTRFLLAAEAGDIEVHMAGETTPRILPIAAGVQLAVRVDRVLASNTTATGIVAQD